MIKVSINNKSIWSKKYLNNLADQILTGIEVIVVNDKTKYNSQKNIDKYKKRVNS